MAEKVTIMKLNVDLECKKCHMKVKKLLGKYPQIQDQRFEWKEHIFITVICCSPEKIMEVLCYKGGGSIKSIEIVETKHENNNGTEKHKSDASTKGTRKPILKKPKTKKKVRFNLPDDMDKPTKKDVDKPKDKAAHDPISMQPQVAGPVGMLYAPTLCYEGRPVGPRYDYSGPMLCYNDYYARPIYDSYGGVQPYYMHPCDQYFNHENPSGCTTM